MKKKLGPEQEKLVTENIKLVSYFIRKLGIDFKDYDEYQDYVSVAKIGLVNAAIAYKPEKKYAFSTYAGKCIINELYSYIEQNKKNIDRRFYRYDYDEDKENFENYGLFLDDNTADLDVEREEEIERIINIILNCLDKKHIIVLFYRIAGVKMKDAASRLGVSSRTITKMKHQSLKVIKERTKYKRKIIFSMTNGKYRFTFYPQDEKEYKKIITSLLDKLKTDEHEFVIVPHTSLAIIEVPPKNESFYFIAEFIYEIM